MEQENKNSNEKDFLLGVPHNLEWEQDPINRFFDLKLIREGEYDV